MPGSTSGTRAKVSCPDRRQVAIAVRKEWMRMMGLDDAEIAMHCAEGTVADLDEELDNLLAMADIQRINEKNTQ